MPINNLLLRVIVAVVPLVLIALIAGTAGYVTSDTETTPIPPLAPGKERPIGIQGSIQSFSNDELTIVANDGTLMTFDLPGESTIERLMTIERDDLKIGDWINGGAIPHRQTILALVGLVLIDDPVMHTP